MGQPLIMTSSSGLKTPPDLFGLALGFMPWLGRIFMLTLAAIISLALIMVFRGSFTNIEERGGALGWTMNPAMAPERRITLVTIDEKSIEQVGPWPWSRAQVAALVRAIDGAGAQLQIHDIVYAEPKVDDGVLVTAMESSSGVVLAQVPVLQSEQLVRTGLMTHPLTGISCNSSYSTAPNFVAPDPAFASLPKGHIAAIMSDDGYIRQIPAFVCVDGVPYPALALSALLQATNSESWAVTVESGKSALGLAPELVLKIDAYPGLAIPLAADGTMRLSFKKDPQAFRAVSAVDVLNDNIGDNFFANGWVLVGATAFGIPGSDVVPTPYSGAVAGVELQARLLASLLDDAVPYTPAAAPWLLLLLSILLGSVLMLLATARGRIAAYGLPLAAIAMPLLALAIHILLLGEMAIWLGWVQPAVFCVFAASLLLLLEQRRVRGERDLVYENLNSYLPSDIAADIALRAPDSDVLVSRREVTLLCADIRNFSSLGESRPAEESAAVLHYFFTLATAVVESCGGRIQEFKADSLLAVWDGQGSAAAHSALAAADQLQLAMHDDGLVQNPLANQPPLAVGIGIEQGLALIGSIGPAHRRTPTLLGDTVTATIRIQEMTAELAQNILLGECAARSLAGQDLEAQGSYLLHGLTTPQALFAPASSGGPAKRAASRRASLKVVAGGRQ